MKNSQWQTTPKQKTELQEKLFALSDEDYADFQAKLTPGIEKERFIGVRMPLLRKFAKDFFKTSQCEEFMQSLPHYYYDENLLHAVLLCQIKDYEQCMDNVEAFLPFIDNWAVCDSLAPAVFAKRKPELLKKIKRWIKSNETYTIRFGVGMLMRHFLDEDFRPEYLDIASKIKIDEYYVNMMTAWYFATALAKQWDAAVPYLEQRRLPEWVHRKTIRKAIESYRISSEQKRYLRSL